MLHGSGTIDGVTFYNLASIRVQGLETSASMRAVGSKFSSTTCRYIGGLAVFTLAKQPNWNHLAMWDDFRRRYLGLEPEERDRSSAGTLLPLRSGGGQRR